jgi:hypothetical protein
MSLLRNGDGDRDFVDFVNVMAIVVSYIVSLNISKGLYKRILI